MRATGKCGMILPSHANTQEVLQFKDFFDESNLPQPDKSFGWWDAVPDSEWGMLANDQKGDCVPAGQGHYVKYANAAQKKSVVIRDEDTLSDYYAINGNQFDLGTDPVVAGNYFQQTGMLDADGNRHKIAGMVALEIGNFQQLALAMWLFDGVGICVDLPRSAEQQFAAGQVWEVVSRSPSIGGHYIFGMGINSHGNIVAVTWGGLTGIVPSWFKFYNNYLLAYVNPEALDAKQLSRRGYDEPALMKALNQVADI